VGCGRCGDRSLGYLDGVIRPLTTLLVIGLTCAGAEGAAYDGARCAEVPGWEFVIKQKPSPVPYLEPLHNTAVQLDRGRWRWNGSTISELTLFQYLRQAAGMRPVPATLVQFSSELDCAAKRALKKRIRRASGCGQQGPPCLEGTSAEYRRSRRLP